MVKIEPVWNPKFSKRIPHNYEDLEELVDKIYSKYQKVEAQKNYKTEQKESKVMTVQVDINEGKVISSENKPRYHNTLRKIS